MFALLLVLLAPAHAQTTPDDQGGGTGLSGDIDIGDIDIGVTGSTGLTYTGGVSQESGELAVNSKITVNANGATSVVVRCTDYTSIKGRVDFVVEGVNEGPMKAYGDSVKMSATGGGSSGAVSVIVGSKPAGVKSATITVSLSVPKEAVLTVNGSGGRVDVSGCDGSVTINAGKGATLEGHLKAFSVTSNDDASVVVSGESKITGTSKIASKSGVASLVMTMSQDLKVDARAPVVNIEHLVQGTVGPTAIAGNIGAGGPTLTLTSGKEVAVRTQ